MAAKDTETAFKQSTEFAMYGASALAAVGIATGVLYSKTACDMNLAEWNLVNSVIAGAIAFTSYFAIKVSPKALSLSCKCLSLDCSFSELLSQGVLPASVSVGQALMPILALVWGIHGLSAIRYGTCSSTAPLLFGISATEMLLQTVGIAAAAGYIMHSSGFTLEKLKDAIINLSVKCKDFCIDFTSNFGSYMKKFWEHLVDFVQKGCKCCCEFCTNVWNCLPKCFCCDYWRGAEGRPLLG